MRFDELSQVQKQVIVAQVLSMLDGAHIDDNPASLVHRIDQNLGPVIFRAEIAGKNELAAWWPSNTPVPTRVNSPTGSRTPLVIPARVAGGLPASTGPVQMPRPPFTQSPVSGAQRQSNRQRRRFWLLFLLIPLIALILALCPLSPGFIGRFGNPATPIVKVTPPTTTTTTPPKTTQYVCQYDPAVELGKEAGGKTPSDLGTAHARSDGDENCEMFFDSHMHSFVAQIGWIIEEHRSDGQVYVWVADGYTIVNPHENILTFVEFYGSTEAANSHAWDAAADWHVELGIAWSMIHVHTIVVHRSLNYR